MDPVVSARSDPGERPTEDALFNVLISSAGRRVSLLRSFRHSLADLALEGMVFASDASPLSAAFHTSDGGFIVPPCSEPSFIPALLEICVSQRIRLVIPTIDTELASLAAYRGDFEAIGTAVAVSSSDVIATCSDKVLTHEFLTRSGFPTVRQATLAEARGEPESWRGPVVVKPRRGSAGVGMLVVNDVSDLPTKGHPEDLIVQSVAPGEEYTVDVLVNHQAEVVCAVPRRRIEVRSGEVSKGAIERVPEISALAHDICAELTGSYGVLTVQLFFDRDRGSLNVIEINPRFGGGFPLTWQAGGHYPRWIIEDILGMPVGNRDDAWQDGIVMLRFDDAVFVTRDEVGVDS
jgi:carbamoyl-phosphate synthase large subunit